MPFYMKVRLFLLLPAFLLWVTVLTAQNRQIAFVEKPWADIMALAAKEKKVIFLDAYTSWCGPCKWMAANMFTNDTIADLYNSSFICAHFDMEKGEGIQLARDYQVRAYPTLLFISPEGEVLHIRVGAPQKVREYVEMAGIALSPGESFSGYVKRYQDGHRDAAFMVRYLSRLQGAYLPVNEPLEAYFGSVPAQDLISRDNWLLLYLYVNDIDSREFNYLLGHRKEFSERYTADSVNSKIYNVFLQALTSFGRNRPFDDSVYAQNKRKIRESGFPEADQIIFTGDLNLYQVQGETAKFTALALEGTDHFFGDDYQMLNRVAWHFLQVTTDKSSLEKAMGWAQRSVKLKSTPENNNTCANLAWKLGKKEEAVKYATAAVEKAREDKTSTQVYEETLKRFTAGP